VIQISKSHAIATAACSALLNLRLYLRPNLYLNFMRVAAAITALALGTALTPASAQTVDPSTLIGKVLVGYQGWFRCPGDGSPGNNWSHWSSNNAVPSAATITVDDYPDLTGMDPASLCPAVNYTIQGKPAYLFSSYPKQTAETHFAWMQEYGIDGVLAQRFIGEIPNQVAEHENSLRNIMAAAQDHGRVFAVEYDLSADYTGYSNAQILAVLQNDWNHLVNDLGITRSPAYLRHNGKPLVSLWGIGLTGNHISDPVLAREIITWFQQTAHATVMGGVSNGWATPGQNGSAPGAGWAAVYAQLDVIQPWTVGVNSTIADANAYLTQHLQPEMALTAKNHQLYMPVLIPGSADHNADRSSYPNGAARLGGTLLWQQAYNARSVGAHAVKIAMFDEINEGTAIFKVASLRSQAPDQGYWLTLDADGDVLPSDFYMRLAYEIKRTLAGTIPNSATLPATPWLTTAANCGVLKSLQNLTPGRSISSCDGRFKLLLQLDGNLVIYQGSRAIWASGTVNQRVAQVLMQHDGNLVEYTALGKAVWSSDTAGNYGAFIRLQDDGILSLIGSKGVVRSTAQ